MAAVPAAPPGPVNVGASLRGGWRPRSPAFPGVGAEGDVGGDGHVGGDPKSASAGAPVLGEAPTSTLGASWWRR